MSHGGETSSIEDVQRPRMRTTGVAAVLGSGIVAAALVPGSRVGLSFLLAALAIAMAVAIADPREMSGHAVLFGGLGLTLAIAPVIRTAEWVIGVDLLAAVGSGCIAVTGAKTWRSVFSAPFAVLAASRRVPGDLSRPVSEALRNGGSEGLGTWVRTVGLSLGLVVVFGTLFVSADAAFARLANDVLVPEVELARASLRVITFGMTVMLAGALVLAGPVFAGSAGSHRWTWRMSTGQRRSLRLIEWALPIAVLDLLFASFVAVQLTVLFGGRHHVELTPGLTYAEYARQGFFQLLAVAALVLVVVAVTVHLVRAEDVKGRRLAQGLLGALCLLTLVVLSSAWYRLGVYEDVYGLTRLRVSVYAAIAWLGTIFALVILAGAVWNASWLPRAAAVLTGLGLLVFTLASPDALIAERNVARFDATGNIDLGYLATLSEDALPALSELPGEMRACLLAEIASDRGTRDDRGWTEFNFSRHRARSLLDRFDVPNELPAGCHGVATRY